MLSPQLLEKVVKRLLKLHKAYGKIVDEMELNPEIKQTLLDFSDIIDAESMVLKEMIGLLGEDPCELDGRSEQICTECEWEPVCVDCGIITNRDSWKNLRKGK
jgi:hypothetical protein